MADMSPEAKKRLSSVLKLVRVTFQYGFIPTVLYMGFKRGADEGMPPLELASILWG
ncbi:mitochondrial import receptor subunit TOM7 homolog [Mytilus galloprovincialis]|uniref:Mitochondrial import receptor subunit TOM7 homolog n=1 Tax=Mytilus galloprovincialis TaxID=29158 RepID=A0A8B6HH97_MYTGA|nr:mitochondrial import receptor subunit TOM7 [Mytilus galloprovincialis]